MTKQEFQKLKVGDVIVNDRGEEYRIKDDWLYGRPNQVFYAERIKPERYHAVQLSENNTQYWEKK